MPPIPLLLIASRLQAFAGRTSRPPSGRCFGPARPAVALLALVIPILVAARAHAGCNLIPSAEQSFRGALGATNKPYAGPGDFVEVGLAPGRCDALSLGFGAEGDDHVVSIVFTPTGGTPRVVFLTTDACSGGKPKALRAACESTVGVGNVACVQAADNDLAVVTRNGIPRLSFRFPDTDAYFPPAADGRTLAGPATIAVTAAGAPLPCGLATSPCASATNVLACVDELYDADGTCQQNLGKTFSHFTALPQANDYASLCFANSPAPCNPTSSELRMTTDAAGNLLVPFNWQGLLATNGGVPVPRLLRATMRSPLGFSVPDPVFLGSYTPEGAKLPPLFEPTADPTVADPDVVTLFGSVDAPYTILRIARRAGTCSNAPGKSCVVATDCPAGGSCPTTCVGGSTPGAVCANDAQCSGGRCGTLFADFAPLAASGGPIPLTRTPATTGVCQLEPHAPCTMPANCAGVGNTCVSYAFEARAQVALESLYQGTTDQLAFTLEERVDLADHNGDGDTTDSVITLRDRLTGDSESLGAPAGCGLVGPPEGRAVVRISEPPFNFPASAIENDILAFLESEPGQKQCDIDGNGDVSGAIARVFKLGSGEIPMSPPRAVDAGLVVNGQSLAVSNGRVFFRSSEREMAARTTTRASLTTGGAGPNADSLVSTVSYDGRLVIFSSTATDLPNPNLFGCESLYIRDRVANTLEQIDPAADGGQARCYSSGGGSSHAKMSRDGRWVAFSSDDWNLQSTVFDPMIPAAFDVQLRDRCVSNGVAVPSCTPSNTRVSVAYDGSHCAGPAGRYSDHPVVSDDGRYIAFISNCTNLVPGDTNNRQDVFVRDTCRSNGVAVPGCTAATERISGLPGSPDIGNSLLGDVDMSADGRYVTYNYQISVSVSSQGLLRDRTLGTTEVSNSSTSPLSNSRQRISPDGRYLLLATNANIFGDSNGKDDLFLRDRVTGTTERVTIGTDGSQGDDFTFVGDMSRDARYIAFRTLDTTLLGTGDTNGKNDIYVRDRLLNTTKRVSLAYNGAQATVGTTDYFSPGFAISGDGQTVAFESLDANLLPPGTDTNGKTDVFVRAVNAADPTGIDNLLFDNNQLTDSVLEVLNTGTSTLQTLCPATQVAVANGMAAFLRPESAVGTVACPGGSLNGDADATDTVAELWPGAGNAQSLGVAARAVAMSPNAIGAIVDELGQNNTILNADGDAIDGVVEVHPPTVAGVWTNTGQAADTLEMCGPLAVFLTPESAKAAAGSLNPPDTDTLDRVLQIWDTGTNLLTNTQRAGEEFVCGPSLVAFRTSEAAQGVDLDGDGDTSDDVLMVYDPATHTVHDSQQAVTPCRIPECDPRIPYRVFTSSVKFLSRECDQHGPVSSFGCAAGTDLNGDGDADDLVIRVFDLATGTTTTVGTVTGGNPLAGGDPGTTSGTAYVASGACREFGGACTTNAECAVGSFCEFGTCTRDQGVCSSNDDCPPGTTCEPRGIVPASPDTDDDGIPDHLDDCIFVANPDQTDTDGDGTGDACDAETCGNGLLEVSEVCDGVVGLCPGACLADCTCPCTNPVADPKAKVTVKTKGEKGQLGAKMLIPLAAYNGEQVNVRLDDGDTQPIAERTLRAVPASGSSGKQWKFKSKSGLTQVQLKNLDPKQPGTFQLAVQAKKWFSAAAANDTAANTRLTVTIGSQCYMLPVTKKTD